MRNLNLKRIGPKLLLVYITMVLVSCAEQVKNQEGTVFTGKELMEDHCTSCHLIPNPKNLDKTTWRSYVLPRMGYMLGFRNQPDSSLVAFQDIGEGEKISEKYSPYLIAKTPKLSNENWQKLQDYILGLAPEVLPKGKSKVTWNTKLFEVQKVEIPLPRPATTLTKFISPGHLIAGDASNGGTLLHLDDKLRMEKSDSVGTNLVHVKKQDDLYWLTHMGSTFSATDNPNGNISHYSENGKVKRIIDSLTRPVHTAYGNLSGNGNTELVVSEFGRWTGRLSWWKENNGTYESKELISFPGAIRSEIVDLDKDGKNDVVALFGQGDEAIYICYNQGNGEFNTEKILQFPPTYGSTYFTMIDYNKDGHLDILYTAGDLGDYTPIAKPYHGIRIFLNNKQNQFKEIIFIPLYGIYKAIAEDFDNDGDLDVAAISYFPKYNKEFFIFEENLGNDWFMPKLVEEANLGRWMTMDCMDYDQDGDKDLVLGSYDWEQNSIHKGDIIPLVYLKNTTID